MSEKQQRVEQILLSLRKLGYLSRSQLQKLHRLGGVRNTNRVLKEMAQYLNVIRLHENVYYLNAEGRAMIGCERVFKKTLQVEHYLRRNGLYIAYGQPSSWRNEMKLEVPGEVSIVADALFEKDGIMCIVEVDRTQGMAENRDKIKRYRCLLELGVFKQPPAFLWVTETPYRKQQLEKLCEGLRARVFLAKDFII